MEKIKKILIITMTCGEGHNSVSRALKESFENEGYQAKIIQLYGYNEKKVAFENWQYLFACKYFKGIYSYFWEKLNQNDPEKRDKLCVHKTIKRALKNLKTEIDDYAPDCIISTHPYANVAINDLIKLGEISSEIKTVSILTDYCVHPYWEAGIELDYVIAPNERTIQELIKRGYQRDQLKPLGIPVESKFTKSLDQKEAREKLGIKDKFTILILSGNNILGNNLKLIKNILKAQKDFQILCICGKNEKTREEIDDYIEKNEIDNVITFGFVSDIENYMSASDCIVSKGGAISLTEALNVNLPIIVRENMIINEKLNKEFLVSQNSALALQKLKDMKELIENLVGNQILIEEIKKNQKKIVNKNAGKDIVKFVDSIL